MDAVVDRFVVGRKHEKAIKAGIAAALLVGDGLLQIHVEGGPKKFYDGACSKTHHFVYGDIGPDYFMFNNPESACRTCGGLGVDKLTHPELLVPDPKRSIAGGCFVPQAYKYNPETWDGRVMYSLAEGARVFAGHAVEGAARRRSATRSSTGSTRRSRMTSPPEAKTARDKWEGQQTSFHGIARRIERWYRQYRQRGETSSKMEAWLDKVMVERTCADCNGARAARDAAALHHLRQNLVRRRPAPLRRAARVSRHGQSRRARRRRRQAGAEGDPRPARAAPGHRPRLSELQPALGHAVRRRVAAHPPVDADRIGADGHALRARRAEHRPAPEGQRQDDRDARAAPRHRQHRHRRRARRRHDPRRRSHRRDGPGSRRPRRHRRRPGDDRPDPEVARHRRPGSSCRASDRSRRRSERRKGTARRSSFAARARTTSSRST